MDLRSGSSGAEYWPPREPSLISDPYGLRFYWLRGRPSRGQFCAASGGPFPSWFGPPGSLSRPSDKFGMWSAGPSGTHGDHQSPSSPSYFEVRVLPSMGGGIPPCTSFVKSGLSRQACTAVPADPDPKLLRARWLRRDRWRSGWALLGEWRAGPGRALRAGRPTVAPPGWGRGHGPPSASGGGGP